MMGRNVAVTNVSGVAEALAQKYKPNDSPSPSSSSSKNSKSHNKDQKRQKFVNPFVKVQ